MSPPAPPAAQVNFDALATSFGALSNALTYGTLIFALIFAIASILAGLAWGVLVRRAAEKEAREEAERCATRIADEKMAKWLATEAPQIVRRHVENLLNASLGNDDDEKAAEDIGKEAG